jgi:hypothetical protein
MSLSTILSYEEAALQQHAREALKRARGACEDGDPFDTAVARVTTRRMLKDIADADERNAAHIVRSAIEGVEDAHEALADLISERGERGEPLGMALTTYSNMLSHGAPPVRGPEGHPGTNFLANFVIVCLLIDLRQQFPGLQLRRGRDSGVRANRRRPSACSVVSAVLIEAGLNRGSEESIRKIWEHYGPPAIPTRSGPPKNGVLRVVSHDTR